jgi:hypothetical protein
VEVFERLVVGCFVFGHQLDADVGEVAAGNVDGFAGGRFDLDCAVADVIGQGGELRGNVSYGDFWFCLEYLREDINSLLSDFSEALISVNASVRKSNSYKIMFNSLQPD